MLCDPPAVHPLQYVKGPGKLIVTWTYPLGIASAFLLELWRKEKGGANFQLVEARGTSAASRKYTYKWGVRGTGETYYACVATRCKNCDDSEANCSAPVVIT